MQHEIDNLHQKLREAKEFGADRESQIKLVLMNASNIDKQKKFLQDEVNS